VTIGLKIGPMLFYVVLVYQVVWRHNYLLRKIVHWG